MMNIYFLTNAFGIFWYFSFLTTIFGVFSKKLVYLFLGFFILKNKSVNYENIKKKICNICKKSRFVVANKSLINITHSFIDISCFCQVQCPGVQY